MRNHNHGKLLRVDQLQDRLNISRSKAYELVAEGQFVRLNVGCSIRVTEKSVEEYIDRQIKNFPSENEEIVQIV